MRGHLGIGGYRFLSGRRFAGWHHEACEFDMFRSKWRFLYPRNRSSVAALLSKPAISGAAACFLA